MKMQKGYIELTPSTMALDLELDEPALQLMAVLMTGSREPITYSEMCLRWLAMGLHHDCAGTRSEAEIQLFVSRHIRIKRK